MENQRSKSPFEGPPNPGSPDRLWIWTNKSSTLIDEYVDAEIGLANKSGPNSIATASITFNLVCNSCLIDGASSRELQISPGERVAKVKIQLKSPKASLSATAPKLQPDQIELKGCAFSSQVFLGGSQKALFGRADVVCKKAHSGWQSCGSWHSQFERKPSQLFDVEFSILPSVHF
ncbi:MAG TPA: hypothetical protein VG488_06930 [Candidatus Angelobacter sp.]|nr:hypothetical protein [Candidatus Angelobacter sp.]